MNDLQKIFAVGATLCATLLFANLISKHSKLNKRLANIEGTMRVTYVMATNGMAEIVTGITPAQSSNLYSAVKQLRSDTALDREIKRIKREHNHNWEMQKSSLMAGYTACRLGMSLSNYLADVEAAQNKLLEQKISEAKDGK